MKKFAWARATGLAAAAALFLSAGPLSAQQILNGLTGGGSGAAGSGAGGAGGIGSGGAGGGAGGSGAGSVGLGNRLDVNRTARGLNAAQAVRGATSAGAGVNGRTSVGLGAGARGSAGVNASARTRTGLFSSQGNSGLTEAEADVSAQAELGHDTAAGISGRERAGQQAELTLNHRLAQIDELRDRALANGNTVLLAQADQMEAEARATYQQRIEVLQRGPEESPNAPPAEEPAEPTNVRSRFRAVANGQASGQFDAPSTAPIAGRGRLAAQGDVAGDDEIQVQRPEDFGRMRERAAARTESTGRLTFSPRTPAGQEPRADGQMEGRGDVRGDLPPAGGSDGRFDGRARQQVAGGFDGAGMADTGAWASQKGGARVAPAPNSRFAADLREPGNVRGASSVGGHSTARTDLDTRAVPRGERAAQFQDRAIEQVDYTAEGAGRAGQSAGRVTGAAYARGEGKLGDSPFGDRPGAGWSQDARVETRTAARARSEWDDVPAMDSRSDIGGRTDGLRRTAENDASLEGRSRFSGRVDAPPARPPVDSVSGDEAWPEAPAGWGRADGAAAARSNALGEEAASSRVRANAPRSGATLQSRQSVGGSASRPRATPFVEELPAPPE